MKPEIIKDQIILRERGQISASADVESVKYFVHKGKGNVRWLVGDVANAADYVYKEGGPGSQGFAGREITFPLVEGGELKLTGPWKEGPQELFEATGVDVRGTTPARYIICLNRGSRPNPKANWVSDTVFTGILFEDDRAYSYKERQALGMEHPETMARRFADQLGHSVQMHWDTKSCGSTGPVNPTDPATGKQGLYVAPPA